MGEGCVYPRFCRNPLCLHQRSSLQRLRVQLEQGGYRWISRRVEERKILSHPPLVSVSQFSSFSVDSIVVKWRSSTHINILPLLNIEWLYVLGVLLCCLYFICLSRSVLHSSPPSSVFGRLAFRDCITKFPCPVVSSWVSQCDMVQEIRERGDRGQDIYSPSHLPTRSQFGSGCVLLSKAVGWSYSVPACNSKNFLMGLASHHCLLVSPNFTHNYVNSHFI